MNKKKFMKLLSSSSNSKLLYCTITPLKETNPKPKIDLDKLLRNKNIINNNVDKMTKNKDDITLNNPLPSDTGELKKSTGNIYTKPLKEIHNINILNQKLDAKTLENYTEIDLENKEELITSFADYPKLEHGLDHVLFHKGIHPLKDMESKKYHFPSYLENIHAPNKINKLALPKFIPTSKDDSLHSLAQEKGCKFKTSTSSVTSVMSQLYFLFSQGKQINTTHLTTFKESSSYSAYLRKPTSFYLRPKDNLYSLDIDQGDVTPPNYILMELGRSLEKFFTLPKDTFSSQYLLKDGVTPVDLSNVKEGYHYLKKGNILMRSQIDCHHPDLPRKVFEIKTRGTLGIRMNVEYYTHFSDYQLSRFNGFFNSFEREYYDMARSSFLKYNLQARIGQMDGIFCAYHNTENLLGFEYFSREEIDAVLFGSTHYGDVAFEAICNLLNNLLNTITNQFPGETLKVTVTKPAIDSHGNYSQIFVERITQDQGWKEKELRDNNDIFPKGIIKRPNTQVYNNPIRTYLNNKRKQREFKEPPPIVNDIHYYRLYLNSYVDGVSLRGPLHFNPKQKVQVFFNLKNLTSSSLDIQSIYMDAIYNSELYEDYSVKKKKQNNF